MATRIENPILNSPYEEPTSHWRFDDEGITDQVIARRRRSEHFMPIPAAKKSGGKGTQDELVFDDWTQDRIEEKSLHKPSP